MRWLVVLLLAGLVQTEPLCSVFDPFKVLPDNNKFQIGGAFPLHAGDCIRLLPDAVQEVVAAQWALTHWNQNPANHNSKLGLYAGDTCSRSRESLSQSLRFLDSVGFHEPAECRTPSSAPKLLGLIAPRDGPSAAALGSVLSVSPLPVAAFATPAVDALVRLEVPHLIATTPTLGVYADVLSRFVATMRSNLVTVVDDGEGSERTQRLVEDLRRNEIFVSEVLPASHPNLAMGIEDTDSHLVVVFLTKEQLQVLLEDDAIVALDKMLIWISPDGEALDEIEQEGLLPAEAKVQVVALQQRFRELPQFRDYFLRVLKNNYKSYQLLTSYVEQMFNCTAQSCELNKEMMMAKYIQSRNCEAIIRMTYAFTVAGSEIAANATKERICQFSSNECTQLIMDELLRMDYEFGINDPVEMTGEHLKFYKGKDGAVLAAGLTIDAVHITVNGDESTIERLLSYTTGSPAAVVAGPIGSAAQRFRSICAPFRPFCGQCKSVQTVSNERHFLSIPRHYPMYLLGLFDLHSGPSCNSMTITDISLPMAFVHTVWTFKQRFPQLSLLANLDLGALLVDSCSSAKMAIESVVHAESRCFRFNQAGRNITLVPGSVFGYVSGLSGNSEQGLHGFFGAGEVAIVSSSPDTAESSGAYSATPSGRNQALALLRLLNRMKWQFVSVALSEQDAESLSLFRHFERLALDRGVCLAEVINIGGSRVANLPVAASANVTVVFATARDAAAYLTLTTESPRKVVHVMMGDAHDWYLHEENHEKHLGIVSVQPRDILYGDFREWIETTTPLTLPEHWFWQYIEQKSNCALTQNSKLTYGKLCSGDELLDVKKLGRMTRAGYLSRSLERLLFAMDHVYKRLCPAQTGLCVDFFEKGRPQIVQQLLRSAVEDDVSVYEFVATEDGSADYRQIGNWSTATGLRMQSVYRPYADAVPISLCQPPACKCFLDGDFFQRPLDAFVAPPEDEPESGSYVRRQPAYGAAPVAYKSLFEHLAAGTWRQHPHNFVLLAVVTALSLLTVAVLVLVLVKLYLRVVKGNQSLGISLLVGIFLLYITSYFFIFDPTDSVCRMRVILHGLGYTLCFGVMIAKATQLRNAETLGFSCATHISFWNYWLLLLFILGVQLALSTRWMAEPFMSTLGSGGQMNCTLGREEFVLSNVYVVILLFLALFLNTRNRNIKRNYKETKWLFVSSVICGLVWAAWVIAYLTVPAEYKEAVIVIELLACGTVLLALLFGPKIYILLSYEPVVVEYKPNDQQPNAFHLFEKEETQSHRAASPASTSGDSCRGSSVHSSRAPSEDQSPIFHTVMRKKNKLRRSQSEHELQQAQIGGMPAVPVIRSPSRRDANNAMP